MKLSIDDLQAYLLDHYGGIATEQSMFMKLVEEVGEVAEVLNKRVIANQPAGWFAIP